MARVVYGSIVTRLKGALGGVVFQRIGKTDSLRLNGYNRRNPWSESIETTNQFRQVANSWRFLSASDRQTWYTEAASWPAYNRWGVSRALSGYQLYLFVNRNLLTIGFTAVTACPTYYLPEWSCNFIHNLDLSAATSYLNMVNSRGYAEQLMVYASSLYGASYNAQYPKCTFLVINPSAGSSNPNLYSYLVAFWGRVPVVGERFYIQTRVVITDGTYKGCAAFTQQGFVQVVA